MTEFDGDAGQLQETTHLRLNVGCGEWPLAYYTNLDSDPDAPAQIHQDALEHLAECDPGDYDEIYAGHFLEHLDYDGARAFLAECHRVLSPGGKLGIVVPDTLEVCKRYAAGTIDAIEYPEGTWWPIADLNSVCTVFFYSTVQETPHRWCWELRTLARAMQEAGFERLHEIDRYRDPRLGCGAWYQCGIQGYKPKGES